MRRAIYHVMVAVAMVGLGCVKPPLTDRAMALTRTGHAEEAITLLQSRLEDEPDDLPARRLLIRVLASSGNLPAAKIQVEELGKRSRPDDPTPQIELGHALELTHRFEEALDAYDEAARVAPSSPVGPREGGLRAARWGEADVARERLDEAVRRGARDAETFHALALARIHERDLDGAEQAYRAALVADPDAVDSLVGLASLALLRDDFAGALAAYEALRAKRPSLPTAELGRAYALARLGRKEEAKRAIDHAELLGGPPKNISKLRELIR